MSLVFRDILFFWKPVSYTYLNPDSFTMWTDYMLLGSNRMENEFFTTEGEGVPYQIYTYHYGFSGPYIPAVDLNGQKYSDDNTKITIKQGTPVIAYAYNPDTSTLVLKTIPQDDSDPELVSFKLESVDSEFDYYEIDGHLISEAFKHIVYPGG